MSLGYPRMHYVDQADLVLDVQGVQLLWLDHHCEHKSQHLPDRKRPVNSRPCEEKAFQRVGKEGETCLPGQFSTSAGGEREGCLLKSVSQPLCFPELS